MDNSDFNYLFWGLLALVVLLLFFAGWVPALIVLVAVIAANVITGNKYPVLPEFLNNLVRPK